MRQMEHNSCSVLTRIFRNVMTCVTGGFSVHPDCGVCTIPYIWHFILI